MSGRGILLLLPWVAAMISSAGCSAVTDFGRFHPADGAADTGSDSAAMDGGIPDGMTADSSATDANPGDGGAVDGRVCAAPTAEVCNGEDDDHDGTVDEDFYLDRNPRHCGGCDTPCANQDHATAGCWDGMCLVICDDGYEDCNGDVADGCEIDVRRPANCGACDMACAADLACEAAACVSECSAGLTNCSGACVDTDTSIADCGSCGNVCPGFDSSTPTCASGVCGTRCDVGADDCDGDPSNGCETDVSVPSSCGACGIPCFYENAVAACVERTCALGSCYPNYADVDGVSSNGCEAAVEELVVDCGACGVNCRLECAASTCNPAVQVEAGGVSCAIQSSGALVCWGANDRGQLGDGTTTQRSRPGHVQIPPAALPLPVLNVSSGRAHTCAVLSDNSVWCWGDGREGQLGDGTGAESVDLPVEVTVAGRSDVSFEEVGAGDDFTCARTRSDEVYCWGANGAGQLGNGSTTASPAPVRVDFAAGFSSSLAELTVGGAHACVRTVPGAIWCWGQNESGQLGQGDGASIHYATPQDVPRRDDVAATSVSAGGSHTCFTDTGRNVWCWGANTHGQLGDETLGGHSRPNWAAGRDDSRFDRVEAGSQHTCGHTMTGDIWCWGDNALGQVGDGTTAMRLAPVLIGPGYTQVSAGENHSCALTLTNSLHCWGQNSNGQVGDGTMMSPRQVPVPVITMMPSP